ncbi:pre-mRNA-processing factor 17 [Sporothrix brasiliensis 5110]|uniref:Pre-mRNA-processing factor 17 n=1 Tax=Sporothrix brasiliensis 5110 TaxID=1398154 RepID=A0A0C2F9G3_9PEZI|nr:pre-mRNA-processing factor 17 [Sporothrix brasiliensis 5110]KIH87693.1 pre-mRNA-processing factor 17 [Sporothrix brasiliensis 5110]
MADFGDYPPNMAPQDALVVRSQAEPDHAVVPYSAEDLARPTVGPANPFRRANIGSNTQLVRSAATGTAKRKNVLSGTATEEFVSEHTFRSKHRAVERRGGPARVVLTGDEVKAQNAAVRAGREGKGSATVADGDGAYVGPWAKFQRKTVYDEVDENEEDDGEEYEYEYEDEDEDVVESGTVIPAPAPALARRKQLETVGDETTAFVGSEQYDYQGRTYMHVPQDLDVDLRKEVGSITNFIPRKLVHTWKAPTPGQAVTALRLFPDSGHLMLSGSADNTVRLWDVYHQRELLRTYTGHKRAITDLSFNRDGTRFLTGSHDRWMKLWDTETGQCINRFRTGKTPHCLVFNPSVEGAHEFLSGMSNNKILQWDTRAAASSSGGDGGDSVNEPVQDYDHHLAAINTITFVDENRRFMTTSDDKSVRVWDYNIPVPISYTSEPWMYPLTRAALHPSNKYVAYQSGDNQVLVYSARDKYRQNRKKAFKGHNNAGTAIDVAISPDGQFLASGDTSGYVCFFDWKTCKMYEKLKADPTGGSVNHVVWHPQETSKVVTAGTHGDIKLWD